MLNAAELKTISLADMASFSENAGVGAADALKKRGATDDQAKLMINAVDGLSGRYAAEVAELPTAVELYMFSTAFVDSQLPSTDLFQQKLQSFILQLHDLHVRQHENQGLPTPSVADTIHISNDAYANGHAQNIRTLEAIFQRSEPYAPGSAKAAISSSTIEQLNTTTKAPVDPTQQTPTVLENQPIKAESPIGADHAKQEASRALAVIQEVGSEVYREIGLPRSTLTNAIMLYDLDARQVADVAHLKSSDRNVTPRTYLALRASGLSHEEVIQASDVASEIEGSGQIRIRQLIDTRLLTPRQLSKLNSDPNVVDIEDFIAFANQFGFTGELADENSDCAAALNSLRECFPQGTASEIIHEAIRLSEQRDMRDFDELLAQISDPKEYESTTSTETDEAGEDEEI
ncbi:MAG: hypothetical protein EBZ48_05375 [Proteobacteria bacterium]|nr:hypothetical protein [Pseudomonadota bacterium]